MGLQNKVLVTQQTESEAWDTGTNRPLRQGAYVSCFEAKLVKIWKRPSPKFHFSHLIYTYEAPIMYQAPYEQGLLSNEVDTLAHFLKEAYNQPGNKQVTEISFEASK